jgi:hypothetical protein
MLTGLETVKKNIAEIFRRKRIATLALCQYYAELAVQTFRIKQGSVYGTGGFWANRTWTAFQSVFGKAFEDAANDAMGFFLSHAVEYGVALELANDRRHAALLPTVIDLQDQFMKDLRRIWER